MPTAAASHPHIHVRARVVHARYGRGIVLAINPVNGIARVRFDTEGIHPVMARTLVPEPANMPANVPEPMEFVRTPYRVVWPLDQVAGEGEAS